MRAMTIGLCGIVLIGLCGGLVFGQAGRGQGRDQGLEVHHVAEHPLRHEVTTYLCTFWPGKHG